MYDRFDLGGEAKVSWTAFFDMLKNGRFSKFEKSINSFYELMVSRKFMPNTPAIANFGNVLGMGSACFVLGVDDSIESIMETLKQTAVVFKAGGGMGYNFSNLRPEGDYVSSTSGVASGPISFMMLFDTMTDVIKQGGIRRGANMGILNSNHPDVEKFITAKKGNKALRNFNISVLIMPEFWESYKTIKPYPLVNPRTGQVVREVNARLLFDMIVYQAWESAEPGVIFFDRVNEHNPFLNHLGPIVTTNPCGEVLLYPNESCNLGSINVWTFIRHDANGKTTFDWEGLREAVYAGSRFLDNVIDVNNFPLKAIEEMTLATRKIGLGVMGLADLLFELRATYSSDQGRKLMEELMEFINYHSKIASIELAKERGSLPYYNRSFYPEGRLPFSAFNDRKSWHFEWDKVADMIKRYGVRNGYTTVIAPTGSISMIAGCSSGIEPIYSLVFEKHVKVGSFYYIDPVFERVMTEEGLFGEDLLSDVTEHGGSIQRITYIPEDLKRVYVTAMDIRPEDHIRALAAFQRWTDSSISKTNNFPANATVEDMRESYLLAYRLGCKDVTVFRDTSIKGQVLVAPRKKHESSQSQGKPEEEHVPSAPKLLAAPLVGGSQGVGEQLKICPQCTSQVVYQEGCYICPECGWGACS
jgi:ribonucleoside-diphosphate reductase alpha chain